MAPAPDPKEIYLRAEHEGRRRLSMSAWETLTTGFIAGVTIVFGMVALGVTAALVEPALGPDVATLVGALAFGLGVVFVVIGRTELFTENLFDPVAAAIAEGGRKVWARLALLWFWTLVLNLVGGAVLLSVLLIDGALPGSSEHVLGRIAEEIATKPISGTFARAILAGTLLALLSYLLKAVDTATARILVAYMVGVFLALGPFDHVVVSGLHLLFGVWHTDAVTYTDLGINIAVSTAGNLLGGLGLITLTHTAQIKGS